MNFGIIVRHALNKCELPFDAAHLETAKTECNLVIQSLWNKVKAKYRQSRGQLVTVADSDEYILNRYFDEFVKYSLQGPSSNPRGFEYLDPEEFFRTILLQSESSGSPFYYTFGEMIGVDQQLVTASKIRVNSSLASKTSGSVNVMSGSDRVTSGSDLFNFNDVGRRFRKSGDTRSYKIGALISTTEIQLIEKYRGGSGNAVAYAIGDVGVHVNIQGFVGGQIDSEDVELNGDNYVVTQKTFNTLTSISKSDRTAGNVTAQTEDGTLTVGTMGPGEMEIERQTVLFWPKPSSAETLKYRFFMKHPWLWLDSDRILIPMKYHPLIAKKLERNLRGSFGKTVQQDLIDDIAELQSTFENDAEDMGLTDSVPDSDEQSRYGDRYWYDHFSV